MRGMERREGGKPIIFDDFDIVLRLVVYVLSCFRLYVK